MFNELLSWRPINNTNQKWSMDYFGYIWSFKVKYVSTQMATTKTDTKKAGERSSHRWAFNRAGIQGVNGRKKYSRMINDPTNRISRETIPTYWMMNGEYKVFVPSNQKNTKGISGRR